MHITDLFPTFYAAAGEKKINVYCVENNNSVLLKGGDPLNLPQIDGINQWQTLTNRNVTTTRNEIVLEIDELEQISAFLTRRYKLINGTIFGGIYDANSGATGRENYNPPYNISGVLQSDTNVALNGQITEDSIYQIRKRLDLNGCNGRNFTQINCDAFCLFDLLRDPCETTDISGEEPEVLREMKDKLGQFWGQVVSHKVGEPEENANPRYYNDTWVTWMDFS